MSNSKLLGQLERVFAEQFGGKPEWIVRAPGRVNLIGEHVDYNGGIVLPMGIERQTMLAARRRDDRRIQVWSETIGESASLGWDFDSPETRRKPWSKYVAGVVAVYIHLFESFDSFNIQGDHELTRQAARQICGLDLAIVSNLPVGGGLSSSAALSVAVSRLMFECFNQWIFKVLGNVNLPFHLAMVSQMVEHDYAKVPCGLMDPLCIAACTSGHCLRIDCRDETYEAIPFEDNEVRLLVIDSGVPRSLAGSAYAERRAECAEAARRLNVRTLRDATPESIATSLGGPNERLARRAAHVVSEIRRVEQATDCLRARRWSELGNLMDASHRSLRDRFEVSSPPLDALVEQTRGIDGVYGARLTGAGFGGHAIALVDARSATEVERRMDALLPPGADQRPRYFWTRATNAAEILLAPAANDAISGE